ncbi:MAG: ATP-grasp domain-containing protein [Candidatus Hydrogenedentales bacterium]
MSATILLVGTNPRIARAVARAEALGIYPVAVGELASSAVVERVRTNRADGVLSVSEDAAFGCAIACRGCGLPGPDPDAVRRMRDKGQMREALAGSQAEPCGFAVVASAVEAVAEAKRLRAPWVVKPAMGDRCRGISYIAYAEDMTLGFKRAFAHAVNERVLIEEYVEGDEYVLDGTVAAGELHARSVAIRLRPQPPLLHELGLVAPAGEAVAEALVQAGQHAVDALGYERGPIRIEIIVNARGAHVVEASPCVCGGRFETDLARVAKGVELLDDALLACIGDDTPKPAAHERGAALLWIPARSGVIEEMRGFDEARAVAGVVNVEASARVGDWIGHVLVRQTHERIGHVIAGGVTSEEALAAARDALARCEVVTRQTISAG